MLLHFDKDDKASKNQGRENWQKFYVKIRATGLCLVIRYKRL